MIGQFSGAYLTVRPAKFKSFQIKMFCLLFEPIDIIHIFTNLVFLVNTISDGTCKLWLKHFALGPFLHQSWCKTFGPLLTIQTSNLARRRYKVMTHTIQNTQN